MSYQQLHAGKVKLNGLAGIRHHLLDRERVKTNPDIDLTRSHLNHSIEDLSPQNLISDVRLRIKQLNLKRKPRTDAVGLDTEMIHCHKVFFLSPANRRFKERSDWHIFKSIYRVRTRDF